MASQYKVAFTTGANKGIGFETARGLGELSIAVVIGSRDEADDLGHPVQAIGISQ